MLSYICKVNRMVLDHFKKDIPCAKDIRAVVHSRAELLESLLEPFLWSQEFSFEDLPILTVEADIDDEEIDDPLQGNSRKFRVSPISSPSPSP